MSTRAEQVEACKLVSEGDAFIHWDNDVRDNVASAAATLTRDGELRERLEKLVEEWRNREEAMNLHYAESLGGDTCAEEREALLKETSDEG